jgi:hypothetical protein
MADPDPGGPKTPGPRSTGTKFISTSYLCQCPTFGFTNLFHTRQSTEIMMKEHISQDFSLMRSVGQYLIQNPYGSGPMNCWIMILCHVWKCKGLHGYNLQVLQKSKMISHFVLQNPDHDSNFFVMLFPDTHRVRKP